VPEKQAHLFAVAPPGLEQMLHRELVGLGIAGARLDEGGVSFRGDRRTLYRANLHSRIASRILVRIARFRASASPAASQNCITPTRWLSGLRE